MTYINKSKLLIPKDESDDNIWADYIELLCILKNDSIVNLDYVIDNVQDSIDSEKKEKEIFEAISGSTEDSQVELSKNLFDDEEEDGFDIGLRKNYNIDDKLKRRIIDKFEFTKLRSYTFKDDYPFFSHNDNIELKKIDELTSKQKIYIILLVSSLLRSITKKGIFVVTHKFEDLCGPIFKKLLPLNSKVECIGAGNKSDEDLNQLFYKKVERISKELSIPLGRDFTPENAGKHNVGDGGLDWWGYLPFSDKLNHNPVYFAQCACGRNWIDKQYDAHPTKWKNYLQFKNIPVTIHLIPTSYRDFDTSWYNPINLGEVILIDRLRLLELLTENEAQEIFNDYSDLWKELIDADSKIDFFD